MAEAAAPSVQGRTNHVSCSPGATLRQAILLASGPHLSRLPWVQDKIRRMRVSDLGARERGGGRASRGSVRPAHVFCTGRNHYYLQLCSTISFNPTRVRPIHGLLTGLAQHNLTLPASSQTLFCPRASWTFSKASYPHSHPLFLSLLSFLSSTRDIISWNHHLVIIILWLWLLLLT